MEKIVFLGKGGIGKSTIAANVSAALAREGKRVLHVGCDPKQDSTLLLMGRPIVPFARDIGGPLPGGVRDSILPARPKGVHCVEAGGPRPGVGCAGVGIALLLEGMKSEGLLRRGAYDAMVFDVLGDVVCGGFAAPMRKGFADKAVIIASEEGMAIYAANNLLRMVANCAENGVRLAGLVANVKDVSAAAPLLRFAARANTEVLCVIPRHPAVARAERGNHTVVESEPGSELARTFSRLAARLLEPVPARSFAPLEPAALSRIISRGPREQDAALAKPPAARALRLAPAADTAALELREVRHNQIFCSLTGAGFRCRVIFMPAASSGGGLRRNDWTVCFDPRHATVPAAARTALERACGSLERLSFEQLVNRLLAASVRSRGLQGWFRWQDRNRAWYPGESGGHRGEFDPFFFID
ncbi:MAG: AAA family ATPase, partial [Elusimicrobia bacterium]|nr:AAA family ATPase [Elusimicrobiota bacterium]